MVDHLDLLPCSKQCRACAPSEQQIRQAFACCPMCITSGMVALQKWILEDDAIAELEYELVLLQKSNKKANVSDEKILARVRHHCHTGRCAKEFTKLEEGRLMDVYLVTDV